MAPAPASGHTGRGRAARRPEPADRRTMVLRALAAAGRPLSIAQLADELGVHPNTIRFHLDALLGTGQVEQVPPDRTGPGRPASLFRAVRGMDPTGPRQYHMLAGLLLRTLATVPDHRARAVAAGRAQGRDLAAVRPDDTRAERADAVDLLVDLLDDLGFAPERRDTQVALRRCPFLELTEDHSQVVCSIHVGLMQGALDAWQSPVTVTGLDAFAEPDLCLAHLAPPGQGAHEPSRTHRQPSRPVDPRIHR